MDERTEQTPEQTPEQSASKFKALRIWPVVLLLIAMAVARFLPKMVEGESMIVFAIMVLGPVVLGLGILIWWATFSRATKAEKFIGFVGAVIAGAIALALVDKSMLGPGMLIATVPLGTAAFGIGAILFSRMHSFNRTLLMLLLASCGFGFTTLLASKGMWGNGEVDWAWRWEPTAEQNMLATRDAAPTISLDAIEMTELDAWLANPEWPKFRGEDQAGRQSGIEFGVNWNASEPEELWRVPVGPGWSSFVVAGNLLFTQEQLGDQEAVVCYAADFGKEIWKQLIESRFYDPLGGPGPRATPTLAQGGLFAMGANGQLQRLDPKSGDVEWVADVREVAEREPPAWGFSSSPLVTGSVVVVHAGGASDKGILAFDIESGDLKWSAPSGDHSYSSPQSWSQDGIEYVLVLTNGGLNVIDAQTGETKLDYNWPHNGYRVLQPQVVNGDCVLLASQEIGTRLVQLTPSSSGVEADELWTCELLRPDFNDFVVHNDHLYGFDGTFFACVDLDTGERVWKGGRYGKGQVLLLADTNVLLVISEEGEAILVKTDPTAHHELAKLQMLNARTWNHPVVIGDRLFLRNSEEAACYRLPKAVE